MATREGEKKADERVVLTELTDERAEWRTHARAISTTGGEMGLSASRFFFQVTMEFIKNNELIMNGHG